jgi:hypothetical protein
MRRRLAVLPATVSALLLLTSPVAAGTLDQQQTDFNNAHAVQAPVWEVAQVFTAGLTGQLDQVDLLLSTGSISEDLTDDLTVEIWIVAGGAPDAPIPGASATVARADVPNGAPLWVPVPISAPSVAGTQYAIVLSTGTSGTCPSNCWQWAFQEDTAAPYAGGAAYFSSDGGANWAVLEASDPDADFAFRTYVAPPAPAASLADASMASPSPASPLTTLGFGLLLVSSLGVLLVANVRRQTR